MINPLIEVWDSPFGSPPFDRIKISHYKQAVRRSIRKAITEIKNIAGNPEPPDFINTIEAIEKAGADLGRVTPVLFNLNSAETSKELQETTQLVSPLLTKFSNDITLNRKLFKRIKEVYEKRESSFLDAEQRMLTEKKYRSFMLGGAGLKNKERQRFREISGKLSLLSLKFEENLLEETNSFELHITSKADLKGLPENIIEMASMEAAERKKKGWVFTLQFPSYIPFMQYSEKRNLREKMFRAYASRGFKGNKYDNSHIISEIVSLRHEMATMLGFTSYAEMILGDRMAESVSKVENFLAELYKASAGAAIMDFENVSKLAARSGHKGPIQRWDWSFYSEKLKKELYNIDDEVLKPYFSLANTEKAIFSLASELYGIKFVRNHTEPVYHPEVSVFEVYDQDGSFLSLLYTDYHPRNGKSGGAWMTSYREQSINADKDIRPIISIVCNFTRPTSTRPSLLSFSELTTFLHEFGHALHGMMTRCKYESLSGTNVARDFVELPSQLMENFAYEKSWLDRWATHYLTGEKIPEDIIIKIREASVYNEGYACLRQLGFAFLDMAWHSGKDVGSGILEFERKATEKAELFPYAEGTCISASFGHIFGGGYAAGYYGYKWAEVLDADAYEHFSERGIFDRETAGSFRKNILEKGGTEKALDLYVRFRGREPSLEPFIKRSGLVRK